MTKPKPKQKISAFIPYYTHKPIEKPKSLHKGVIDCEYSSCGWMQRGKCECPNHRYEERIAQLEAEVMGLEGCCQVLEKAFGVPKKASLKQIDERIGYFVKLEKELKTAKEQGKLDQGFSLEKKTLEKNNEGLTKVRHNHLTVDSAYNDGIRIGQEQGKKELVELFEDKFLWKKYRNDGGELFREVHKWLKSQLLITTNECQISSSQKEGENQDRGEKLFHELTYDKFKEIKKQGAK